jgi:hypothetical protein
MNFNSEDLPVLKIAVEGSIKIDDVAVMWLVNRSKTVNVTEFTISRPQGDNETAEQYVYPKNYGNRPLAGTSLATYHNPTVVDYTITVVWEDTASGATGVIGPFEAQFPRGLDYKYYLYRARNGEIVVVAEDKMTELPPDPEDTTFPDPGTPSIDNAHTMVVINATPDQGIDEVEFSKIPYTYVIAKEPRAKDQEMILLGIGSYEAKVRYTRDGVKKETTVKNAIVTGESGSMAVRTNFLYFYKTTAADYQITQTWPPIPNDASDENNPEASLLDSQGILEIVNNAVPNNPHSLIARININGDEYPNTTNTSSYMGPGDAPRRYVLNVGAVHVSFRPTDQTYYGQVSTREIKSRQVTTLSYTNDLGNPFVFPEDTGNGTGLIRITNNTTGVVVSTIVNDRIDLSKSLSIGYEGFNPPMPINYGKVGIVPVIGTPDVPLAPGVSQLIQISLETADGLVTVERVAALRDQIVDIVLNQSSLDIGGDGNGGRRGSRVIVKNDTETSTNILGLYVYNAKNAAAGAIYSLDLPNPPRGGEKSLYILSTTGLPIVEGEEYKARLSVYGNGLVGVIDKDFSPDGGLYSTDPDNHLRTITLTQADLPQDLVGSFTPVTGITISPSPYPLNSITESKLDGSGKTLKVGGSLNLNHAVVVSPPDATKKSPIAWTLSSGPTDCVTLNAANSVLTVTKIAPEGNRTLTLTAAIEDGAGTITSKTTFSTAVQVLLTYQNTVPSVQVSGIVLSPANVEKGHTQDLRALASLNPVGANINGVPITVNDLIWTITGSNTTGSLIDNGSIFTAGGTPGNVTIQAKLPADKNGGAEKTATVTVKVVDTAGPPFIPVTGITTTTGALVLPFYTKTASSGVKTLIGGPYQMNLASYLVVVPANASVQSPISFEILSTTAPAGTVILRNNQTLSVEGSANHGNTVELKATIPNSISGGSGTFAYNFTVTLEEHNSRFVEPGEITAAAATIQVGQSLDLAALLTLPADAYADPPGSPVPGGPITAADLGWAIYGGSGQGTLSGAGDSTITGTAAGQVLVRATLPVEKNGGQFGNSVTAQTVITVTPITPATFTLRVIKLNGSDYVSQIALVPRVETYSSGIYSTGHTAVKWADSFTYGGKDPSWKNSFQEFLKQFPDSQILTITKVDKEGDYTDITITWPSGAYNGYNLFFIEGDSRVRGYVNPGKLDPPKDKNFLFFLRPDYLYANSRIWMKGDKEAAPNSAGAVEVIPIGYNSYYNTTSVMKPAGVGKRPTHDLSDF